MRYLLIIIAGILLSLPFWNLLYAPPHEDMMKSFEEQYIQALKIDKLDFEGHHIPRNIVNIFTYRDTVRRPPAPKPPPPPPVKVKPEPVVQPRISPNYNLAGYSVENGDMKVFLIVNSNVIIAQTGDIIEEIWEVVDIDRQRIEFIHMETGQNATIEFP